VIKDYILVIGSLGVDLRGKYATNYY